MYSNTELKLKLQQIKQADYPLPPVDQLTPLIEAMLAHVGDLDAELRDDLIYSTFARWISRGLLSPDQMQAVLEDALDDRHLFFGLGQENTDTVFTRTFSLLLLPPILIAHRQNPFLSAGELLEIKDALVEYAGQERDRRGYVPGKGWAHAAAHASDALDDLARCMEMGREDLLEMLSAIRLLASEDRLTYVNEEDERMSVAAVAVVERQALGLDEWQAWLMQLINPVLEPKPFLEGQPRRVNVRNFLRSFFFRTRKLAAAGQMNGEIVEGLLGETERAIQKIARF